MPLSHGLLLALAACADGTATLPGPTSTPADTAPPVDTAPTTPTAPLVCPTAGVPSYDAVLEAPPFDEVSGVVVGRRNPGALWLQEDSGNDPNLYAVDAAGAVLGTWALPVDADDLEDLAIRVDPADGVSRIYVADIGDNDWRTTPRDEIAVYVVVEPALPGDGELSIEATIHLVYPDYPRDAEALLVDPVNGDLIIATKSYAGDVTLLRKAAPHVDGEHATLVPFGALDLPFATTAGDISDDGAYVLLRGYSPHAKLWLRAPGQTLDAAFAEQPCELDLAFELQSESAAFSADATEVWTIAEQLPRIWRTPLTR